MPEDNPPTPPFIAETSDTRELYDDQRAHAAGITAVDSALENLDKHTVAPETSTPTSEDIPRFEFKVAGFKSDDVYLPLAQSTETAIRSLRTKNPADYTAEEQQLVQDTNFIETIAPYATLYKEVYTPQEIRKLVASLSELEDRKSPEMDELCAKMADYILTNRTRSEEYDRGITALAQTYVDNPGRSLAWKSINRIAQVSLIYLHDTLKKMPKGMSHQIAIDNAPRAADVPSTLNNIKPVYQFAASLFTQTVLAERQEQIRGTRHTTFIQNCQSINDWYAKLSPVLNRLPADIKGEKVAARWELRVLVDTMNDRLNNDETLGPKKSYRYDAVGAFRQQLAIRDLVESIREQLNEYTPPEETEIVPLDP